MGEKIIETRLDGTSYTLLTSDILRELNFVDNGKCTFKNFENMNYWVRKGVCLFYNTPISVDYQDKFYIGYAEMRNGEYTAVAFKWIDSVDALIEIYESIVNENIVG